MDWKCQKGALESVQEILASMQPHWPTDVTSVGESVFNDLSTMKASELRTFWLSLAPALLSPEIVPNPVRRSMLLDFACAVQAIDRPSVTLTQINRAHHFLGLFVDSFKTVFGVAAVRPNHHLHAHLAGALRDWGPISNFWSFSLERMMKTLSDVYTNNRRVEIQLARSWESTNKIIRPESYFTRVTEWPTEVLDEQRRLAGEQNEAFDSKHDHLWAGQMSFLTSLGHDVLSAIWTSGPNPSLVFVGRSDLDLGAALQLPLTSGGQGTGAEPAAIVLDRPSHAPVRLNDVDVAWLRHALTIAYKQFADGEHATFLRFDGEVRTAQSARVLGEVVGTHQDKRSERSSLIVALFQESKGSFSRRPARVVQIVEFGVKLPASMEQFQLATMTAEYAAAHQLTAERTAALAAWDNQPPTRHTWIKVEWFVLAPYGGADEVEQRRFSLAPRYHATQHDQRRDLSPWLPLTRVLARFVPMRVLSGVERSSDVTHACMLPRRVVNV